MLDMSDINNIFIVAARLKRMEAAKAFMGTAAFKAEFTTLMDLIENWKKQNESKN